MAAKQTLERMHLLIWALIYGGLLTLVLGLATARADEELGWALCAAGGALAAVGVVLIGVRSRLTASA
ncbi:MAG: hypothetical protein V4679_18555 [Pseudomonadota bacterium]